MKDLPGLHSQILSLLDIALKDISLTQKDLWVL